ncbi:MAG: DUF4105 domain-containing protein [Bacteroidota bacterium]
MLRISFIVLCLVFSHHAHTQQFSDSLKISILTGSSGEDLYTLFGHSAIRVQDYKFDKDYVFNYGTFDFDTPNFYLKFLRGKLEYVLSIGNTKRLIAAYERDGRVLTEQKLLIDRTSQQEIVRFLVDNYQPQNRAYKYDFFYDNCATRIREILESELSVKYVGDTTGVRSFRDLLGIYTNQQSWIDFGIDLLLGIPADKMASKAEEMFLPELLSQNIQTHLVQAQKQPILDSKQQLTKVSNSGKVYQNESFLNPSFVFLLMFLLIIAMTFALSPKLMYVVDGVFFTLLGIAGSLLTFMWFGTDHEATQQNLNIIWLNPLYIFIPLFFTLKEHPLYKRLLWGFLIINVVLLGCWNILPQALPTASIWIILAASLRCLDRLGLFNLRGRNALG